jgi:ParB-like chromosome segregation protein Spo0J
VQPFHQLPPAIETASRASIERFGVLLPVVKDQYGRILDGHQRVRMAEELGKPYTTLIHQVASDEEALAIAKTLNAELRPD